ncbi:MAG: Sapep family Mn(2+)-dependent dipeptidase [Bacillota bacterium]|nr:Sapep family Mn(2+)-dependent dipeptidase [Bacillota bacterium]
MTDMDFSRIDKVLEAYYPQMERDLMGLLACPSVKAEPAGEGAPFGQGIADALEYALAMSSTLGFQANNVDGYAGFADLPGETEEQVGILAHLDVVPAEAKDWDSDPFSPVVVDGRIVARGTLDDKGPLVAAMYGALALADCGIKMNKTVRFIMGCDEESGMACMSHYLTKYAPPACSFSPDAEFPLIVAEKGVAHYSLSKSWDAAAAPCLLQMESGSVANVVPGEACAILSWPAGKELPAPAEGISVEQSADTLRVKASGHAAHASMPEQGENALMKLVRFLNGLELQGGGADFLRSLGALYEDDRYGAGLGIAEETEKGRLTSVPSVLHLDEKGAKLLGDIRFLYEHTEDEIFAMLEKAVAPHGLLLGDWLAQNPLYLGEEHPLAQKLLGVYREFTGDMTPPLMIGGGTYAKTFPNCLAFGPEKIGEPNLVHQPNEFITQANFLELAKIYARAIYALAK